MFNYLKYNRVISLCQKRREFFLKLNVFKAWHAIKIVSISLSCKLHKANEFHLLSLRKKMKKFLSVIKNKRRASLTKVNVFYTTILKIRAFKQLRSFLYLNKEKETNLAKRFRNFFAKLKAFNLLKFFLMIKQREKRIVYKISILFSKKRFRSIQNAISSWKKFYIVEKYKKIKMMQRRVKIFYVWKMLAEGKFY